MVDQLFSKVRLCLWGTVEHVLMLHLKKNCAVKRLIEINRIQNKSFCLHNICVCSVYIYYVYINPHTYSIYFENIYMSIFIFI